MKKHYVPKHLYVNSYMARAVCGELISCLAVFRKGIEATYRKNHVTCGNCRRTKVFRGVK